RPYVLVPVVVAILTISAFQATKSIGDLILMLAAMGVGFFMKSYGWPRPPIIIAIVLGETVEKYFFLSMNNFGVLGTFTRPVVLIMIAIAVATAAYTMYTRKAARLQPASDLAA
ncbi:MAG TPA: tripartite tricarboxylate transporter permease, partial [Reyranella sp.]|nr:tripartite tricarboxylate transporter permease [Reyranella sp.]